MFDFQKHELLAANVAVYIPSYLCLIILKDISEIRTYRDIDAKIDHEMPQRYIRRKGIIKH